MLIPAEPGFAGPHYHACPGCGALGVRDDRYACKPCWNRLPWELRDRIMATWSAKRRAPSDIHAAVAHRNAMEAGGIWYRGHPAA